MFSALLNVPVKILLSIAGALLALNFGAFITKHFGDTDRPIVAHEIVDCRSHDHGVVVQMNGIEEERARLTALQGLLFQEEIQAELDELAVQHDRLNKERQNRLDKILMIYR
ncbi:MAG: hypothetical protein HKN43_16215 [Rhodothermales bacterium]|nr:hypothetical protein [Rhodothermales bacterium]